MPTGQITVNVDLVLRRPRLSRMLVRISRIVIEPVPLCLVDSFVDMFGRMLFRTCYEARIGGRRI